MQDKKDREYWVAGGSESQDSMCHLRLFQI